MNYHRIDEHDTNNGEGVRTVLWVSGCIHDCEGCHNPTTHSFDSGQLYDGVAMKKVLDSLKDEYVDGITLSGGDPMHPNNLVGLMVTLEKIRELHPAKSIWCYTGFRMEQLEEMYNKELLVKYFDVIIDGEFEKENYDPELTFRGSSNQIMWINNRDEFIKED